MGIMVHSLLWAMPGLYHQPSFSLPEFVLLLGLTVYIMSLLHRVHCEGVKSGESVPVLTLHIREQSSLLLQSCFPWYCCCCILHPNPLKTPRRNKQLLGIQNF